MNQLRLPALLLLLGSCCFAFAAQTQPPNSLDSLLQQVLSNRQSEQHENKQREARFRAERTKQQQRLEQLRSELKAAQQIEQQLKSQFESNQQQRLEQQQRLAQASAHLGELFGSVRQVAGESATVFKNSLVSAQIPQRDLFLKQLASSATLPTSDEIQRLWHLLLQETIESGKITRFNAQVISPDGLEHQAEVIRIGLFSAIAEGKYLNYLPSVGKMAELSRQPDNRYLLLAEEYSTATADYLPLAIDPTRGSLLNLLVQKPDLSERIQQGGLIGYVILFLGLCALIITIARLVSLHQTQRKIERQIEQEQASNDNPLGRILAVYEQHQGTDLETLELHLDEAITNETPRLEKGIVLLKTIAAVAPLLGLLGTVLGMIVTFQSITLYGTGDPKLMASGISQALVTTVLGLCVAIPTLFFHSQISSRSKWLVQLLENQSIGIIARRTETS